MQTRRFAQRFCAVALIAGSIAGLAGVGGASASASRVEYLGHVHAVESATYAARRVANWANALPRNAGASWSDQTLAQQLNLGDLAHVLTTSCVSSTFCVAGGTYTNASGAQAFVSLYDGSSWSVVSLGAALNLGGLAQVNAVSCVSPTFCVAGGQYEDASGSYQAFVSRYNGSSWTDVELGAALNLGGGAYLNAVSCVSSTFCVAGGEYTDASGGYQAFVSRYNGVSWTDGELGAALNLGGSAQVNAVSCVSTTFCVAGGQYTNGSGMSQALVSRYNGSSWTDGELGAALNLGGSAKVNAVSCVSPTFCVAGGQYTDGSGMSQALVSVFGGSSWSDQTLALTLNLLGSAQVNAVSCASPSYCVAGGDYTGLTGIEALVSLYGRSTWADQTVASALNLGGNATVHSALCVADGFCLAGGTYTDAANHAQAFVSMYDSVLTPLAPVAPTFVSATSSVTVVSRRRSQTLTATWSSVEGATSYRCQLLYGPTTPASAPVTTTSTSCRFSGRRVGIRYAIGVAALNAIGASTTAVRFIAPPVFTITCTHGRRRLRRSGINPRCPAGWATR